jgi:hypothetical protein
MYTIYFFNIKSIFDRKNNIFAGEPIALRHSIRTRIAAVVALRCNIMSSGLPVPLQNYKVSQFSPSSLCQYREHEICRPPITYSCCCQRYGKSSSSGKSGRIRAVPDETPPGIYDQSALFTPYATIVDLAPTPEAKEDVFSPGWTPRMKLRALKIGADGKISGNAVCRKYCLTPKDCISQLAPQILGLYGTPKGVSDACFIISSDRLFAAFFTAVVNSALLIFGRVRPISQPRSRIPLITAGSFCRIKFLYCSSPVVKKSSEAAWIFEFIALPVS